MDRAYLNFEIKAVDEERRTVRGIATTNRKDRVGDIIDPLGCEFEPVVSLLHQHFHDRPVGTVRFKKPTKAGIEFEAQIERVDEPGPLKDRLDTCWREAQLRLVRGCSIGFRPIEYNYMEDGGIHYSRIEIIELSLVTIPANPDAVLTDVSAAKSAARGTAARRSPVVRLSDAEKPKSGVVKLNPIARARIAGTLKVHTAPRNKPGDPFRVRRIVRTGAVVVKLAPETCPWLNRSKAPAAVVKLAPVDVERAKRRSTTRVVKLGRR